jgi:hypothetical protein
MSAYFWCTCVLARLTRRVACAWKLSQVLSAFFQRAWDVLSSLTSCALASHTSVAATVALPRCRWQDVAASAIVGKGVYLPRASSNFGFDLEVNSPPS